MLGTLALLAAGGVAVVVVLLRERFARLEREVASLREEVRKISAPVQVPAAASSPALPVAFPLPPVVFAPPAIHPSEQTTAAVAAAPRHDSGAPMRGGAEKPPVDWESFVGVKLFSWIAGVFLTIGAVLFLRYSIDRGWFSPPVQMAIGLLAGIGLLIACERSFPPTGSRPCAPEEKVDGQRLRARPRSRASRRHRRASRPAVLPARSCRKGRGARVPTSSNSRNKGRRAEDRRRSIR